MLFTGFWGFGVLGFWSKDEILHAAHGWSVSQIPFYLGCFGALLTALYVPVTLTEPIVTPTVPLLTTNAGPSVAKDGAAVAPLEMST